MAAKEVLEEPPFGFPFPPYSIQASSPLITDYYSFLPTYLPKTRSFRFQVDFMGEFYRCLNESGLGIFESPTGTGKSLSIICSTLSWLKDHQESRKVKLRSEINKGAGSDDDDDDDWFASAVKKSKENQAKAQFRAELKFLEEKEARMAELKKRRKSVNRNVVMAADAEFDELFRDLDEVREAVAKELRDLNKREGSQVYLLTRPPLLSHSSRHRGTFKI